MTNKTITLISRDGHNTEITGELVRKDSSAFEVKLSPGATLNIFYSVEWKIKPTPLPTEPGSVIRATIRGVPGVVAWLDIDGDWEITTLQSDYDSRYIKAEDIDLITVEIGRVTFGDES